MRLVVAVVLALCVFALATAPASITADPSTATPVQIQDVTTGSDVENASQTIAIRVHADGDADVTVAKRFGLDTQEDRESFARLADDFERGETDLSADSFEQIATEASHNTDREMEIRDVSRTTNATNETGTLVLSFTWTNFAESDDESLVVEDVFLIDGETWLPELVDGQRLVIHPPDGYAVDSAPTGVTGGTAVWEGPTTFDHGEIRVTYVQSGSSGGWGPLSLTTMVGALIVVAVLAALYALVRGRRNEPLIPGDVMTTGRESTDGGTTTSATPPAGPEPEADRSDPDDADDSEAPFADTDVELLSDEERVVRLLEANGGRMKQANIVTETKWSNAKVSQLLSSMAEDDRIEKLRIGRENLITLVDEEE